MLMTQMESARSFGSKCSNTALAFFSGLSSCTEMSEQSFMPNLVVYSCRFNCSRSQCELIPNVRICPDIWGGLDFGEESTQLKIRIVGLFPSPLAHCEALETGMAGTI